MSAVGPPPAALVVSCANRVIRAGAHALSSAAMSISMKDRVVVVTGASSGIGAVVAEKVGQKGGRAVLLARREPELREVARRAGNDALVVVADVTRREEIDRAVARGAGAPRPHRRLDQQRRPRHHAQRLRAHRRRLRRDDAGQRQVGALRHAGGAAAFPRARQRAHHQRLVDARARSRSRRFARRTSRPSTR